MSADSLDPRQPGGKPGRFAPRPHPGRPPSERGKPVSYGPNPPAKKHDWWAMVHNTATDARLNPLSVRLRFLQVILDQQCRGKAYLWTSNSELAAWYGCEIRNMGDMLRELEEAGVIYREMAGAKRGDDRIGIVLLKRCHPDAPVADTPEALKLAVAMLKEQREASRQAPSKRQKTASPGMQKTASPGMQKTATELRSLSEEDGAEENAGEEKALDPRRRPEETPPSPPPPTPHRAEPVASPEPVEAALAPAPGPEPSDGLTAEMLAFLANLTPQQRARFEKYSPARRDQAVRDAAHGLLKSVLKDLGTAPPPEPPPPDAGPLELIAALSVPLGATLASRCASAIMATLGDRGGGTSFRAIDKLCREVVERQRPPESLAEPLEGTLRAMDEGTAKNPAAYWMRGVSNWDKEH